MDSQNVIPVGLRPANMSTSKQNRILIWRDEVASAADALDAESSVNGIAPSFTSSSTATTTSSASTTSPPRSRSRNLWKRLSRRLSSIARGSDAPPSDAELSPRTAMYRELPASAALAKLNSAAAPRDDGDLKVAEEMALDAESSNGRAGGLKEKQERLERAARLLDQASKQD
ncbi:hypothetical protein S40285_00803 [Stachybotrys chlorohalonatus IBT 40285]|uniref:Uncharacterized protein n=1 Tax=Stachybotrys chlorohalonatus (strain IBT 40285) TaxID=1283841 RepID=A0A084QJS7_STAC4|nr:hypothetical protein S40285_00803 [Stachybotrys chlorohalonata IBT 40285]